MLSVVIQDVYALTVLTQEVIALSVENVIQDVCALTVLNLGGLCPKCCDLGGYCPKMVRLVVVSVLVYAQGKTLLRRFTVCDRPVDLL